MANVFAAFKATKNLGTKLTCMLADSSVELSTLAIVVLAKIRLRCFRQQKKFGSSVKMLK